VSDWLQRSGVGRAVLAVGRSLKAIFGWIVGKRSAWVALLLWIFGTVVGLIVSQGINSILDRVSGQQITVTGAFGQGQLLAPAALLAIGAAGKLLWKAGPAPAALRLLVGTGSILIAFIAVGLSVDLHESGAIVTALVNAGMAHPIGSPADWPTWLTTNSLVPTPEVTAKVSEWLYVSTFVTGAICLVLSEL
jgi:hypothetical protein